MFFLDFPARYICILVAEQRIRNYQDENTEYAIIHLILMKNGSSALSLLKIKVALHLVNFPLNIKFTNCETTSAPIRYGTLIKNCFQINSLAQQGLSIFLFKKKAKLLNVFRKE